MKKTAYQAQEFQSELYCVFDKYVRFLIFMHRGLYHGYSSFQWNRLFCWFGRCEWKYVEPLDRSDCVRCGNQHKGK